MIEKKLTFLSNCEQLIKKILPRYDILLPHGYCGISFLSPLVTQPRKMFRIDFQLFSASNKSLFLANLFVLGIWEPHFHQLSSTTSFEY